MLDNLSKKNTSLRDQVKSKQQSVAKLRNDRQPLEANGEPYTLSLVAREKKVVDSSSNLKVCSTLKGHYGKVYTACWSSDSQQILSASQDGKLLVWNSKTGKKTNVITLRSNWVMTCSFSPSTELIACGGLDNVCSIFAHRSGADLHFEDTTPEAELAKHIGYLSCCAFIDERSILTASGDATVILWDIEKQQPTVTFADHEADVMSLALAQDKHSFVTGSCDASCRLYDLREQECQMSYEGHKADINSVHMMASRNAFFAGSDDGTVSLWEMRCHSILQKYEEEGNPSCVLSVTASKTGRHLYMSLDDRTCIEKDVLTGKLLEQYAGHDDRVCMMLVSPDGTAMCTASWDKTLKIWA